MFALRILYDIEALPLGVRSIEPIKSIKGKILKFDRNKLKVKASEFFF